MKAYFLSDLHLGAPYFKDSREAEMRVVRFLDGIADDADAIYLVGDILDYWYEYRYVVPRGFVRFFGKLAELCDRGISIIWMIGNHDIWIFDYLPKELGIKVYDGIITEEIDGKYFVLSHGDGIGKLKPSFRILRKLFRNRLCQKLFSGIHPRWTVPFAYNWSRSSRKAQGPSQEDAERMMNNITVFSKDYLALHPEINYFVFGHLHLLRDIKIGENTWMIVLGDWISQFTYGYWDGRSFTLNSFQE